MSTFNEKLFAFMGGLFRNDDPWLTANVVSQEATPLPSPATSADEQSGSLSNELQWYKAYQDMMTSFWDINVAEGGFLDTLGHDWLGLTRYPGESDANYQYRIKAYLSADRNTPWGLEQIMRIFSPSLVIIQEGVSGVGTVLRSFFARLTTGSAGYDATQPVAVTTAVSDRSGATFTVADSTGLAAGDTVYFNDGSTTKGYVVQSVGVGSVVVKTGGYLTGYPKTAVPFTHGAAVTFTLSGHGYATGDIIGVTGAVAFADGNYVVTVLTPNTFTIPVTSAADGTATIKFAFIAGALTFGGTTGTLKKYTSAYITPIYIGSISGQLLRIRITIASNALTNNPAIARFLYQMANNSKIPGSRVEIRKV